MLSLFANRRSVPLACRNLLFRPGALINSAVSAVVADPSVALIDHRCVVNVVNHGDVHVVDRAIVEKVSTIPPPAFVTVAKVAVAIIDSAIKAHSRSPITFIKKEPATAPSPIPRSPQKTNFRRQHPRSRNPVVIAEVGVVSPIARRPD